MAARASSRPGRRHGVSRTTTSARKTRPRGSEEGPRVRRRGAASGSAMDWRAVDALTDEEVVARAMTDPDNRPLTKADVARLRRRPRAYIVRRALRMTQEEF